MLKRRTASAGFFSQIWDNKAYKQLPNKSSTSKAIKYALNNETALRRLLDNGNIEIDNNAAE